MEHYLIQVEQRLLSESFEEVLPGSVGGPRRTGVCPWPSYSAVGQTPRGSGPRRDCKAAYQRPAVMQQVVYRLDPMAGVDMDLGPDRLFRLSDLLTEFDAAGLDRLPAVDRDGLVQAAMANRSL